MEELLIFCATIIIILIVLVIYQYKENDTYNKGYEDGFYQGIMKSQKEK